MINIFQFGKTWLEKTVKNLFDTTSVEILQSIITFLHSSRSNDELQAELFDLLGFDKFEFIQNLLQNRQDIITSLQSQPQPPPPKSKFSNRYCILQRQVYYTVVW